ncbi:hypothetical protein NA56DRAFT_642962 [Hyaloscypha hepaticicola]|uniref:Uncharacterized protein n=1 Tax=Hyaloscypha hepaticicola TaxID=2082293 RepID=A0A2J6QG07_9HELO|nr:hypothetical protein NA56DRAFT_642962 [Hyaloscypha hepaticicola]
MEALSACPALPCTCLFCFRLCVPQPSLLVKQSLELLSYTQLCVTEILACAKLPCFLASCSGFSLWLRIPATSPS